MESTSSGTSFRPIADAASATAAAALPPIPASKPLVLAPADYLHMLLARVQTSRRVRETFIGAAEDAPLHLAEPNGKTL